MGCSGMVQKLMRERGPSTSTRLKYCLPLLIVVQALKLKSTMTRAEIDCVPTRVCPYSLSGSKARHMIWNC